jgi:hypothetical protein
MSSPNPEPPMSFRPFALIVACTLMACDVAVEGNPGPEQARENVFSYRAPLQAGQTLVLRNMSGRMTVEPAPDDTLRVVADMTWRGDSTLPSDVRFRSELMANGVVVCAIVGEGRCSADDYESNSDGTGFSIGKRGVRLGMGGPSQAAVHFRVQVPTGVRLDLVMIDGNIVSASSAPVKARGANGDITVVTSVGPVTAKSVNGNVDVRMTTLAGSDTVEVETVNGSVAAYLPADVSADVQVRALNGSLLSDFPGLAAGSRRFDKTISGVLGSGMTPVRVGAVNGNATLRRLDAQGRPIELSAP